MNKNIIFSILAVIIVAMGMVVANQFFNQEDPGQAELIMRPAPRPEFNRPDPSASSGDSQSSSPTAPFSSSAPQVEEVKTPAVVVIDDRPLTGVMDAPLVEPGSGSLSRATPQKLEASEPVRTPAAQAEKIPPAPVKPAAASSDKPGPAPAEKPQTAPAEKPQTAPAEKPQAAPAEKTAPAQVKPAAPAEKPQPTAADRPADKPASEKAAEKGTIKTRALNVDGGFVLRLTGSMPMSYHTTVLKDPERLVVDLPGTWDMKAPGVPKNNIVTKVRVGRQADKTRIVVDMSDAPSSYRVHSLNSNTVEIRVKGK